MIQISTCNYHASFSVSQANATVFTRQKRQYDTWYDNWCSSNPPPLADTQQQCDEWLLGGMAASNNVITERNSEEYNGQTRYRYTTNQRADE